MVIVFQVFYILHVFDKLKFIIVSLESAIKQK